MKGKILLIDDEPAMLFILKARLEAEQYGVVTAENGSEALQKYKLEKPDLVVTDVMMPGMTGYEFFEALRGLGGEASKVPVIVMSARGSMGQFFDKWAIRCFIPKPLEIPAFLREIDAAVKAYQGSQGRGREPAQKKETGKALLAGVSEYEIRKMREFLEARGYCVFVALDEKDLLRTAQDEMPHFIVFQYWDDPLRFDAVTLSKDLAALAGTKKIPHAIFCGAALTIDAAKYFSSRQVLDFTDTASLLQKLEAWLGTIKKERSGG